MFEKSLELIKKYDTIIIHRHINPDGDAIGSQVGLKFLILENFPDKKVYIVGDEPGRYSFMEYSSPDVIPDDVYTDALAIVLDTSGAELISDQRYKTAKETLRIDHHIQAAPLTDYEVDDTSYESCCGLITTFAIEQNLKINPIVAKSLFTGIVTDSGRFRYDATTSRTFELASFLMKTPFETDSIYRNLYSQNFDDVLLRAKFVMKVKFTTHNVAYIYTTKEEADSYNRDFFYISRGMVSVMSDIKGVDIWINFTESDRGVIVEVRSTKYNINKIAVKYGGGGHEKASGATLKDRETAMQMLMDLDKLAEENM
ncbi:MAG: bifunctional oligoribonuclease/PAP phosphatase NrnA [Clostridiales bacterium]|nr:bifunctional oligoribonuclease/PAP phosphatase NrnA [Clostridiales bacterium]